MKKFIGPKVNRFQHTFLQESLDESLSSDHPVRVYDFVLSQHDWFEWESGYPGGGRPAYPPDAMCKLLVYGYSRGIRSSRQLEYACINNRDFIWLMSGCTPDHDTIADFRRGNIRKFKGIFRTSVTACIEAGLVDLKQVAVDGTRVEANNSRKRTGTMSDIDLKLKLVDAKIEKTLQEAEEADRQEDDLYGAGVSPNVLPEGLRDIEKRRETLRKAYEKVCAKVKRAKERGEKKEKAEKKRVPTTDTDADVMKDKRGSFGPNFGPWIAGDAKRMIIVGEGVTNEQTDAPHFRDAIEDAEEMTGLKVEQALADSNYSTTENLGYCEERGIEPCMAQQKTNPDKKEDRCDVPWPDDVPQQAPHAAGGTVDGGTILRDKDGIFDKSAFVYDRENDCYICPTGHPLIRVGTAKSKRVKYRCRDFMSCPFAKVCTSSKDGRRSIGRQADADIQERHASRMKDERLIGNYKLRRSTVEPMFGTIKGPQGFRRFLLRNLDYVRGEWSIACAAFNLKRLANTMAAN
ncbi:MAG: IS1182 family transposase [Methanosarcinaceae archaeon]|nr:IS1182 family transposase [Methanosarcinaceae archaeon]